VVLRGQEAVDGLGNRGKLEELYRRLKWELLPLPTQISVTEYLAFFTTYAEKRLPIVYLGLSSGFGGSFTNAVKAKARLLERYPDGELQLVDTLAGGAGVGRLVLEAIRLKRAGLSLDEVTAWFAHNKLRLREWVTVTHLRPLYHGRQIAHLPVLLEGLLRLRPVLAVNSTGHLQFLSGSRTRQKALIRLAEQVLTVLVNDPHQPILLATSGDWPATQRIRDYILHRHPRANIQIVPLGPVVACHTGFGCVAAFAMATEPRE